MHADNSSADTTGGKINLVRYWKIHQPIRRAGSEDDHYHQNSQDRLSRVFARAMLLGEERAWPSLWGESGSSDVLLDIHTHYYLTVTAPVIFFKIQINAELLSSSPRPFCTRTHKTHQQPTEGARHLRVSQMIKRQQKNKGAQLALLFILPRGTAPKRTVKGDNAHRAMHSGVKQEWVLNNSAVILCIRSFPYHLFIFFRETEITIHV